MNETAGLPSECVMPSSERTSGLLVFTMKVYEECKSHAEMDH